MTPDSELLSLIVSFSAAIGWQMVMPS